MSVSGHYELAYIHGACDPSNARFELEWVGIDDMHACVMCIALGK